MGENQEAVGNEDAVARDHSGLGVELASERARDLNGLHAALEGFRERAVDRSLKPSFEAVKKPQGFPHLTPSEYDDVSRWA
jgi:hypothetical protein